MNTRRLSGLFLVVAACSEKPVPPTEGAAFAGAAKAAWYPGAGPAGPVRADWSLVLPSSAKRYVANPNAMAALKGDVLVTTDGNGRLIAADANSGALKWEAAVKDVDAPSFGPFIVDNVVWLASKHTLLGVDVASGSVKVSVEHDARPDSVVALKDKVVMAGDKGVFAFDPAGKMEPLTVGENFNGVAYEAGHFFIGESNGTITVFDAKNKNGPKASVGSHLTAGPAVAGEVVVATGIFERQQQVCAFTVADAKKKWCTPLPCGEYPAPRQVAVSTDKVFVVACGVHAFSLADGKQAWSETIAGANGFAGAGGVLYVSGSKLEARDAATGKVQWELAGPMGGFSSPPLVANGKVYAVGNDGVVYAIAASSAPAAPTPAAGKPPAFEPALAALSRLDLAAAGEEALRAVGQQPKDSDALGLALALMTSRPSEAVLRARATTASGDAGTPAAALPPLKKFDEGATLYVTAGSLNVRSKPGTGGSVLAALWAGAKLESFGAATKDGYVHVRITVLAVTNGHFIVPNVPWGFTEKGAPAAAPPAPSEEAGDAGVEEDTGPSVSYDGLTKDIEGWAYSGFLDTEAPPPAADVAVKVADKLKAGEQAEAGRLLELARSLGADGETRKKLVAAAIQLKKWPVAVQIASGGGTGLVDWVGLAIACRGKLEKAEIVQDSAPWSVKNGGTPWSSCLFGVDVTPPCPPCEDQNCSEPSPEEARREERERRAAANEFQQGLRRARNQWKLATAWFKDFGPTLWVTLRNGSGSRTPERVLKIHSPEVNNAECWMMGSEGPARTAATGFVPIPSMGPDEKIEMLVALDGLEGQYKGISSGDEGEAMTATLLNGTGFQISVEGDSSAPELIEGGQVCGR